MGDDKGAENVCNVPRYDISVVSEHVIPKNFVKHAEISREEVATAHWCVMEHCTEAAEFIRIHQEDLLQLAPQISDEDRIQHFHPYFRNWV